MTQKTNPGENRRVVRGGQGPREERGMRPTNQAPRPTVAPPKPSDVKKT